MSRLKRNLLALFLGCCLGGAATWASAVDLYEYRNSCMSLVDISADIKAQFIYANAAGQVEQLHGIAQDDGTGELIFSLGHSDYVDTPEFVGYTDIWSQKKLTFNPCNVDSEPPNEGVLVFSSDNRLVFLIAFVLLWAIGFSVGMKR